jgi:hypothetical protein
VTAAGMRRRDDEFDLTQKTDKIRFTGNPA